MRLVADPSLVVFSDPWTARRGRIGPFFLSLGAHVLIVMAVLTENYYRPPLQLHIETPEQLLADGRYKLTWPVLPADLPPVQPIAKPQPVARPKAGNNKPPRFRLPQQVAANDPNAASSRQMVWDQAPQVELPKDVRSPNFVEPQMPAMQRPRFKPAGEQPQAAPSRRALTPEQAPQVATATPAAPDPLQQAPRLRYWAPQGQQATPSKQALAAQAAPVVSAGAGKGLSLGELQNTSRLRYWAPQQGADAPGKQALQPGQAPQIQAAPAPGVDVAEFQRLSRLRYQQAAGSSGTAEAAPTRTALAAEADASPNLGSAGAGAANPGEALELIEAQTLASLGDISAPGTEPGRAVVGVDPDATAPLPERGSRGGNFTAGPDGGASAAGAGTGDGPGSDGAVAGLRIPNLSVTPAAPGAPTGLADVRPPAPDSTAGSPNTDRQTLLDRFRQASFEARPEIGALSADSPPDPDLPFPGRAVYTLAVNMPNINSYSGSWIIEFTEAKGADGLPGELSPPSPRVKVDPVYSREAIDEHIEGDVVLHAMIRSDGLVDQIEILKRLDVRLDESAKVALSKWRFHPATKRGVPVDIETVVRIPFRLTPVADPRR